MQTTPADLRDDAVQHPSPQAPADLRGDGLRTWHEDAHGDGQRTWLDVERSMTCAIWTDWKSSEAVSNGPCSTDRMTCGVERMLRLLALPRVQSMEALMQRRLYPRTWH